MQGKCPRAVGDEFDPDIYLSHVGHTMIRLETASSQYANPGHDPDHLLHTFQHLHISEPDAEHAEYRKLLSFGFSDSAVTYFFLPTDSTVFLDQLFQTDHTSCFCRIFLRC